MRGGESKKRHPLRPFPRGGRDCVPRNSAREAAAGAPPLLKPSPPPPRTFPPRTAVSANLVPAVAKPSTFWAAPAGTNTALGPSKTYAIDGVTITATAGNHGGGISDFSTVTLTNEKLVSNNRGAGQQGLGTCVNQC